VIKLDIVNAILKKFEEDGVAVSRVKAEQAVETVFESLKNSMGRGQRIELRRFGVFSVRPRKTGIGRNPRTGEEVSIPPGKVVRFKPGKELQGMEDEAAAKS
jgi:DNA-binding protein HU-beta